MINLLVDSLLHSEYLDALSQNDKIRFMQATRSIARKCLIAGRKVGLSEDSSISYKTCEISQDIITKKW